jgi:NAD(P)H-dependent flavin oxidoreductase YrpB (nitropropane dioxygenase family)
VSQRILAEYFVEGGIASDTLFRPVPRHTMSTGRRLWELTVAANFAEVWLAKQTHDGEVGINYLRKIDLPLLGAMYGAVLAGVDDVLVGAGSPAEVPALLHRLAQNRGVSLSTKVQGARSTDHLGTVRFSPRAVFGAAQVDRVGELTAPRTIAIVASTALARALFEDPETRPGGFVIEGPSAGGHNAPPRGPRRLDDLGQPVYDERDEVDVAAVVGLGLPVWLAGSFARPERLATALALGAAGVQVGTAFAYCAESGLDDALRERALRAIDAGELTVRADWRASPTGFPFHVAELSGTWTDPDTAAARQPVCDLGVLRAAYRTEDGSVGFRCPSEPGAQYLRKGGREANREGRVCLCNALLATAGMPQHRRNSIDEPALLTSGSDLAPVVEIMRRSGARPDTPYSARDVVNHLLGA